MENKTTTTITIKKKLFIIQIMLSYTEKISRAYRYIREQEQKYLKKKGSGSVCLLQNLIFFFF